MALYNLRTCWTFSKIACLLQYLSNQFLNAILGIIVDLKNDCISLRICFDVVIWKTFLVQLNNWIVDSLAQQIQQIVETVRWETKSNICRIFAEKSLIVAIRDDCRCFPFRFFIQRDFHWNARWHDTNLLQIHEIPLKSNTLNYFYEP